MKREGIFCDKKDGEGRRNVEMCPEIAIGKCISCDEDVCAKHGRVDGITLVLNRAVIGSQQDLLLGSGAVTLCEPCLSRLAGKTLLLKENIIPSLLSTVSEVVKAALVGEALR